MNLVGSSLTLLGMSTLLSACTAGPPSTPPRDLVVAEATDLGPLTTSARVRTRDGGESALLGDKVLWTFGDTFFEGDAASDGERYRSNSAALSDPADPLRLTEPVDESGAPYPFIPFTPDETAYNEASGQPDDRIALWVGGIHVVGESGLVFFSKLGVKPGTLNYEHLGVGLARVGAGETTSTRLPDLLFSADEPAFTHPLARDGLLYIYGNRGGTFGNDVVLARVRPEAAETRSAYTFWDGGSWTPEVAQAAVLFGNVPGAVTVSWNEHLEQFLAVHSFPFSPRLVMRTAPRPEGPWSTPVDAYTATPVDQNGGTEGQVYAGKEHPELARDGGKTVVLSYYRSLAGFLTGELRLVEVTLQ